MRKLLLLGVVMLTGAADAAGGEWVDLIVGGTLRGWSVRGGTATYAIEDGAIVGTTAEGSPNTFLCTDREYGDFVLEFEVKLDPGLNSGVQIRSRVAERETVFWFRGNDGRPRRRVLRPGHVYGYQVEITGTDEGNAGNIYDEARRGFFLDDLGDDPAADNAFKDNEWNAYRVECRGDAMKTWLNGVPCADVRDALADRGIIGLQVHGFRSNFRRLQVRFRNLRIQELE